jgi:hypothetical protein
MKQTNNTTGVTIGWREWLALPTLGIDNIKVKVDTGARTSAIHADFIDPFDNAGEPYVRFGLVNNIGGDQQKIVCEAPVLDKRVITSSSGEKECRYVIGTKIILGGITKDIELTLTNRSTMKFKMLLGRTALSKDFNVAPGKSYVMGRPE